MIALIDGDMLLYRAAYASQTVADFGDGEGDTVLVDEDVAIRNAMKIARDWTKAAGASKAIICLSSVQSDSFRHQLWKPYKSNRTNPKPEAYMAIRKAIEFDYETYQEPGLEADDLMGIAATSERAQCVIVSGDKDMRSIPGLVLNPTKDRRPVKISTQLADMNWMRQTMIGDPVDCYPGIAGVGPAIAEKIITSPHRLRKVTTMVGKKAPKPKTSWVAGEPCSLWQSMVDYAAKGKQSEQDVIQQARVARILRSGDFNKETRTVLLWGPNGKREELRLA